MKMSTTATRGPLCSCIRCRGQRPARGDGEVGLRPWKWAKLGDWSRARLGPGGGGCGSCCVLGHRTAGVWWGCGASGSRHASPPHLQMPRLWLDYCQFLMDQGRVTHTRRTFDRALRALPITQHSRIWPLYLRFLRSHPLPETAVRGYRRFLKVSLGAPGAAGGGGGHSLASRGPPKLAHWTLAPCRMSPDRKWGKGFLRQASVCHLFILLIFASNCCTSSIETGPGTA